MRRRTTCEETPHGGTAAVQQCPGQIVIGSSKGPGLAVFVLEQVVGFLVVGDALGLRVPVEAGPGGQRHVGQECEARRAMARLDIAMGPLPRLDAVEKVADVQNRQVGPALGPWVSPRAESVVSTAGTARPARGRPCTRPLPPRCRDCRACRETRSRQFSRGEIPFASYCPKTSSTPEGNSKITSIVSGIVRSSSTANRPP